MAYIDRLKKIKYQHSKRKANTINANWSNADFVDASQSTLNGVVPDDTTVVDDSEFPVQFLKTDLDWSAGEDDDTIVKIRKDEIYVIQDLVDKNLGRHEFISSSVLGLGYLNKSYYGGL